MSEKFIVGEIDGNHFSAFITTNKNPCENDSEHRWDGDELITFHNDDRILTRSEFDSLSEKEQEELNPASGEVSCSKCGIGYLSYDNPCYSEI